jgi:hypothetical protein
MFVATSVRHLWVCGFSERTVRLTRFVGVHDISKVLMTSMREISNDVRLPVTAEEHVNNLLLII